MEAGIVIAKRKRRETVTVLLRVSREIESAVEMQMANIIEQRAVLFDAEKKGRRRL